MTEFYSIITAKGLSSLAMARVTGENIKLIELAVGDSEYYEPLPEQEELVNERYRVNLNRIYIDEDYPNQVIIEAALPEEVGGFFIREVGIFDEAGDLFAIAKYPATFKPSSDSGSGKDLYIRMTLAFSSSPNIEIFENRNNALVSSDRLENLALKDLSNVPASAKNHQGFSNLQGGTEEERYHLTAGQNLTVQNLEGLKEELNAGKCIVLNETGDSFVIRDLPAGLPMFTIFSRLSAETPPGAYPLWTGEYIRNCRELHRDFWEKILEYKTNKLLRIISLEVYEQELATYKETGGFVIDEVSGDLRLPKITRIISSIGELNQIGVPLNDQIQGHWHNVSLRQDSVYSVQPYDDVFGNDGLTTGQSFTSGADERLVPYELLQTPGAALDIISDRVNGVPKVGNETRGRSVQVAQFIQVYSAAIPASMTQASEFVNTLSGKADKTLSNVPGAFYVVAEQRGKNGFIKYSDGRCEQWGLALHEGNSWVTTPFYFDFANNEINLVLNAVTPANLTSGNPTLQLRYDVNKSNFIWHIPGGNNVWYASWHAWGVWK